ncbi:unnamed protein product [Triticum turgidum subsp. durum]|uniref:Fatty acid desaturase N-terminal domain-containing protein n=1 Tax=Triticum turgidum subsp. durum TaxID=4567 RepID=A0A9R0ZYQ5_TRITD|nr:unnamed protein product [Triticum turgidum subsp. durum]
MTCSSMSPASSWCGDHGSREHKIDIMGAGGRMTEEREKQELLGRASASEIFQHAPTDKPAFTLAQIKEAIPPHCFQCSLIKSFSYVVYDLVISVSLLYAALVWIPALLSMQQLGACPLYWVPHFDFLTLRAATRQTGGGRQQ